MKKNASLLGPALIVLAGIFWGSMGIFVRRLGALGFTSLQITAARLVLGALIFCLILLPSLEIALKDRSNHFEIHLELTSSPRLKDFVTTIRELGLKIDDIETNPAYINSGLSVYSVALSIHGAELKKYKTHKEIIEALKTLDYVYFIEEMRS